MVDKVNLDWMESVQLVFDYFCERTPRSFVEARETSLVWNYKYADVEFGRLQARGSSQSAREGGTSRRVFMMFRSHAIHSHHRLGHAARAGPRSEPLPRVLPQARDLLQHLWTGPISNAPVDIIQGAKSVEVRPVGLSKGASMAKVSRQGPLIHDVFECYDEGAPSGTLLHLMGIRDTLHARAPSRTHALSARPLRRSCA